MSSPFTVAVTPYIPHLQNPSFSSCLILFPFHPYFPSFFSHLFFKNLQNLSHFAPTMNCQIKILYVVFHFITHDMNWRFQSFFFFQSTNIPCAPLPYNLNMHRHQKAAYFFTFSQKQQKKKINNKSSAFVLQNPSSSDSNNQIFTAILRKG